MMNLSLDPTIRQQQLTAIKTYVLADATRLATIPAVNGPPPFGFCPEEDIQWLE